MGARGRFILRYTGVGPTPGALLVCLRETPGTKVLDTSDRMLLVEGSQAALEQVAGAHDGWVMCAEKSMPVPDTRQKIKGGPK